MASKSPIVRQVSVISLFFQLLLLALFCVIFYQIDRKNYVNYSFVLFFLLYFVLRYGIPRYQRKGIAHFKKHQYELAIPCFEKSYSFFTKYKWIDKYRFITMLSSSSISYTEMALLNIAFCLSQIGKKEEAIIAYKKVLERFKDSEMAISALKMLE